MKIYSVLKYTSLSLFLLMFISPNLSAQVAGAKTQKLIDYYVMGRFEDCYLKALKMTENDKYKSESEPYLWVALCLIELTRDAELEQYYPEEKTIKSALKFATKFKKKDDKLKSKELDYIFDQNIDFIYELIEMALVQGKSFLAMDNYTKASYYYKLAVKLDPENKEVQMMNGVVFLYAKNRDGQALVDDALVHFTQQSEVGGFKVNARTERAFIDGFYYYTTYLEKKGKKDQAFDVIALAVKLDPKNQKFIQRYKYLSAD